MGVLLDRGVVEGGRVAGRRAARSRGRAVLFFDLSIKNSKQLFDVAVIVFDEGERVIPNDIAHHLEAIAQLDPDEQQSIRALIEGALLRHQARRLAG